MYMFIYFNYPPTQQNKDWKIKGDICILEQSVPEDPESQHVCWAPALSFQASMIPYWCNSQFCGSWHLPVKWQGYRKRKKHMDMGMGTFEVQGRGKSRISCSRLSLFTTHCTHWCSALCNTAQLVKDFMIYPGTLVSRAGWHYFIGYLLWRWFKQSCNKDQNFTRANKVPGGPIPPFVHHNFLLSFVTQ